MGSTPIQPANSQGNTQTPSTKCVLQAGPVSISELSGYYQSPGGWAIHSPVSVFIFSAMAPGVVKPRESWCHGFLPLSVFQLSFLWVSSFSGSFSQPEGLEFPSALAEKVFSFFRSNRSSS